MKVLWRNAGCWNNFYNIGIFLEFLIEFVQIACDLVLMESLEEARNFIRVSPLLHIHENNS